MDEATWASCEDIEEMWDFLENHYDPRKMRLFAAACARRIWHLLSDERSRRAVEAAERYADGLIAGDERKRAENDAVAAWMEFARVGHAGYRDDERDAAHAALRSVEWPNDPFGAAVEAAEAAASAAGYSRD